MNFIEAQSDPRFSFTVQDINDSLVVTPLAVVCSVSGDTSSNYARLKRKGSAGTEYPFRLGAGDDFEIVWESEFDPEFYVNKRGGFRVFGLWNPEQRWRLGLWIDSDNLPRLQIEQGGTLESPRLWGGKTLLPLDRHEYRLRILLHPSDGLVELRQDGFIIGRFEGRTLPNGVDNPVCNELTYAIDGADGILPDFDLKMTIYKMGCQPYADPCFALRRELAEARAALLEARKRHLAALAKLQESGC
jgi:hypothetical protein